MTLTATAVKDNQRKGKKTVGVCGVRLQNKKSENTAASGSLHESEEDFFTVVSAGNIGSLRQFLKKHKKPDGCLDFNINCVNYQNDDAMSVAVDTGNIEIIKCLFSLMHATKNSILMKATFKGDYDLVKSLCETFNADEEALSNNIKVPEGESHHHPSMTPLMLAAIEGHYEVVGYFIGRGHQIGELHQPDCLCEDACQNLLQFSDPLHLASSNLYMYSAMSSPAYIPYATADPIHYCFHISRRLKLLSKTDPPFKKHYDTLDNEVRRFAASLISECRNSREVELALKQPFSFQKNNIHCEYPRLSMAINFNQKEFIAQPKVQMVVERKFYGSFEDWPYLSSLYQFGFGVSRLLTIPIAYFAFLTSPKSSRANYYASPINKMLHFVASYIAFLSVLFLESRAPKPPAHHHSTIPSLWSFIILLYFYGLAGWIVYQILNGGFKYFVSYCWNIYDFMLVITFSLFTAFSISSLVHVRMLEEARERKLWSSFDPQLMAEGFLVISTLMAYLKILFFLQVHYVVGPLQVAVSRLAKHLLVYGLFGGIIVLAFSVSFSHFYAYYSGMSYVSPDTNEKYAQEESFIDLLSTFKTFFWALFGHSDYTVADVVLENENEHLFTQFIGYLAFGSFLVLMVWVFKSMLIALAVEFYRNKEIHSTWLYERTRVFIYFIDGPLLPPPFNCLPHRYTLTSLRNKLDTENFDEENRKIQLRVEYRELTKALVERYFNTKLKNKDQSKGTPSEKKQQDASQKLEKSRCRSL